MSPSSTDLSALLSVTLQLIRLSVDLIQIASSQSSGSSNESDGSKKSESTAEKGGNKTFEAKSRASLDQDVVVNESKPLLESSDGKSSKTNVDGNGIDNSPFNLSALVRFRLFLCGWVILAVSFLVAAVMEPEDSPEHPAFPRSLTIATTIVFVVEMLCLYLDRERLRYGAFQRIIRLVILLTLWVTFMARFLSSGNVATLHRSSSLTLLVVVTLSVLWAVVDGWLAHHHPTPSRRQSLDDSEQKPQLSRGAIFSLIKPYFWPDATNETALWNRVRAIATWICVILSKACNLVTPLVLGQASTSLAHQDYSATIRLSIVYSVLVWLGSTFKEGQSLVYLKVAQTAFEELSAASFDHLHHLSLDWHLRKKLGEVLRSMDRGISACDTLMKYLFLWLVPALAECFLVTVIFATYFDYFPLAIAVFYFVFVYIVFTILVTLWRKKFRKKLVKHDNEWHDLFTDSMVNFETVKYFTAEQYEKKRFSEAVGRYQTGSVHVQGSLSFLNITQKVILQACMATALSLAALGIQQRMDCCIEVGGCESGISDCCRAVPNNQCPGMEVGGFIAVLTYIGNLFAPLNFLGSIYNAVIMAVIDLANLSELLAENPDVVDSPDAFELPRSNHSDPDIAVEFDNVTFRYPTQPATKGLKGLSFKMKRGTTTAVVGPTGAGKTTISRLLFRFYDVLGGAVKINGVDVRTVTQKSLRGAIGVVPQTASMFNDTIKSNLLYGRRDATDEELIQAAEDAQVLGFIESLDEKWETLVGDRGLKLSGGEQQRAAIARCLLKDPPFVILDEATSALDTITESSVQEALDRLGKERTVLVVAHRLGTVRNADQIIVLKDGCVAESGTHDELLQQNGLYGDMWNKQLHSQSSSSQPDLLAIDPLENSNLAS